MRKKNCGFLLPWQSCASLLTWHKNWEPWRGARAPSPYCWRYLKVSDGWSHKMAGFYWRVDSLSRIIWLSLWILISGMCLILFFEAFTTSLSTQSLLINPYHFQVKPSFSTRQKKGMVLPPVTCPLKKRWLEDYFPLKWPLFRAHLCFRGV